MTETFGGMVRKSLQTYVMTPSTIRAEVRAHRSEVEETYVRPAVREHCEPCPVCQAARDAAQRPLGPLPCGHSGDEIIWHSRPCIFVGCRHTAYLDVTRTGSIRFTHGDADPTELEAHRSCTLDIAEEGDKTLEEIAEITNVTRERVRQQIEDAAEIIVAEATRRGMK
jgi:hypothetical protein